MATLPALPSDQVDTLVQVLDLVRFGRARTRPELVRQSRLGRTVVTQRLKQLLEGGLVRMGEAGRSTGGRPPGELEFHAGAGHVLVAELGVTGLAVGITDLAGRLIAEHEEKWDIDAGPRPTLARITDHFDRLIAEHRVQPWGVGVGLPGPVEFASGRPVKPPIMRGWHDFPVRQELQKSYGLPVWVDNEVNTMALGEYRAGRWSGVPDLLYVKIGTGIGAGLVSNGQLHRGAQGCAGDIGHIKLAGLVPGAAGVSCKCGHVGCLEALAGGGALARDATKLADQGQSPVLADLRRRKGGAQAALSAADVIRAAELGDRQSVELLQRAGELVGDVLAALVNFFNPSVVLVGGGVGASSDLLIDAIDRAVRLRSLSLATRNLRIDSSGIGDRAGLIGAGFMVVDQLLSRENLGGWIRAGSPVGRVELTASH